LFKIVNLDNKNVGTIIAFKKAEIHNYLSCRVEIAECGEYASSLKKKHKHDEF
jgi:hypothetical protein